MSKYNLFLAVGAAFFFSSCATVPSPTATGPREAATAGGIVATPSIPQIPSAASRSDVVHVVGLGQTLGMLGKMYDVPASSIASANHLKGNAVLSPGRSLVIPDASALRSVITLFPSRKWKYIILHHSATQRGDSLAFNGAHLKRGFRGGVGYDFVIDNGTLSKQDGEIEATPRWLKQQDGRHCKASHMNSKAIGVCLVGNFNEGKVSERQMASLVFLVDTLRHYYKIPVKKILGHGQVPGADTDCPGRKFPWQEFNSRLGKAVETRGSR